MLNFPKESEQNQNIVKSLKLKKSPSNYLIHFLGFCTYVLFTKIPCTSYIDDPISRHLILVAFSVVPSSCSLCFVLVLCHSRHPYKISPLSWKKNPPLFSDFPNFVFPLLRRFLLSLLSYPFLFSLFWLVFPILCSFIHVRRDLSLWLLESELGFIYISDE